VTSIKHSSFYLFHVLSCCLWFLLAFALFDAVQAAPVDLIEQAPITITSVAPGVVLVDFGKVAFGNLKLSPLAVSNLNTTNELVVRFGEALRDGRIDRKPPRKRLLLRGPISVERGITYRRGSPSDKDFCRGIAKHIGTWLGENTKGMVCVNPFSVGRDRGMERPS